MFVILVSLIAWDLWHVFLLTRVWIGRTWVCYRPTVALSIVLTYLIGHLVLLALTHAPETILESDHVSLGLYGVSLVIVALLFLVDRSKLGANDSITVIGPTIDQFREQMRTFFRANGMMFKETHDGIYLPDVTTFMKLTWARIRGNVRIRSTAPEHQKRLMKSFELDFTQERFQGEGVYILRTIVGRLALVTFWTTYLWFLSRN